MDISQTLASQLQEYEIPYDTVHHRFSITSLNSAHTAHIPETQMVKPVILHDKQGYLMALVPSNRYVYISELNNMLGRNVELVSEAEVSELFSDCESGAIPPVGDAYGMEMVVDFSLDNCDDIYIEAGNHQDLIHMSGQSFQKLTSNSKHADITVH